VHAMLPNGYDIRLGAGTHDDAVGSDDAADRNIVGDATNSGIVIASGSTNNQILNNYIGIGWNPNTSSFTNRGNGARGIYVAGDNTTINGNLIGYNVQAGIVLDSGGAHDNLISGNLIGADGVGMLFANAGAGIHLIGGTGDAPNDNTIRLNTIAANSAQGVLVDIGQRNKIRKNSIFANDALGIDLGAVGPAFPQSDDSVQTPDKANRGQNFPILTSAAGDTALGTVAGTLLTTAGDYTVDVYLSATCDASGYGEGSFWLGSTTVTVPAPTSGNTQNTGPINMQVRQPSDSQLLYGGNKITATATDFLGNTSEFSPCVTYDDNGIFGDGFDPLPE
jgi:Right handed beta helix region